MTPEQRRPPVVGRYTAEELALAARNCGMPLEALRYDVTPAGLHYQLIHFDIPEADADTWRLSVDGLVGRKLSLAVADLQRMRSATLRVTMECAGNGRAQMSPRSPSMPWIEEGMSTAEWTGVPLAEVLREAGVQPGAKDIVFHGADRGTDRGIEHAFARSLVPAEAMREDVLLVYAMNGQPLLPQHGYPLRLVVPGWYGMASVKWLERIEAIDRPFDGLQQAIGYHFRQSAAEKGIPCTHMRVNSAMVPPGDPEFYTRARTVASGSVLIRGRAWSGGGVAVVKVELGVDGRWSEAELDAPAGAWAWRGWRAQWRAEPGEHQLSCRATDANGMVQPLEPAWDISGFGNNAVQRVRITVR